MAPIKAFLGGFGGSEKTESTEITDDDLQFINDMALV